MADQKKIAELGSPARRGPERTREPPNLIHSLVKKLELGGNKYLISNFYFLFQWTWVEGVGQCADDDARVQGTKHQNFFHFTHNLSPPFAHH